MKELNVCLQFLTPAFLGGSDNGRTAELRPPSIKGLLRFWWRSTQAGNPNLRSKEAEIFGDASGSGKASVFSIQIHSGPLSEWISMEILPRKDPAIYIVKGFRLNILEYLAFGTYSYQKAQKRNVFDREYIKPGFQFDLKLRLRDEGNQEGIIKELCTAIKMWSLFGGIGAKSRNGFGNFSIVNIEGHPAFSKLINTNPVTEFKKSLTFQGVPDFSAFSSKARLFKTAEIYPSWDICLAKLGHAYRDARLSLESKHKYIMRQFLGAPIIVNKQQVSFLDRRAKPYFLRVHKERNGYVGYILHLPSRYYLGDEKVLHQNGFTLETADEKFREVCETMNKFLAGKLEEVK